MSNKKHIFKIAIGDWSNDGHGMCEYIHVESNKPVEEVRELYFKNVETTGVNFGKDFCAEYEDPFFDEDQIQLLKNIGIDLKKLFNEETWKQIEEELDTEGKTYIDHEVYRDMLFQFLKLNNDLELTIINDQIPMLQFYGRDEQGRHLDGFGYGLFSH